MRVRPAHPVRTGLSTATAVVVGTALLLGPGLHSGSAHAEDETARYVLTTTGEPAAEAIAERTDGEVVQVPEESVRESTDVVAELTPTEAVRLDARAEVTEVVRDVRVRLAPAQASTRASAPPWGLDRIDQRGTRGDGRYRTPTTGRGTIVAVVDTGLNAGHRDFAGRVLPGYDYVDGDATPQDCDGHGTHVAGTAAGTTYGAAPEAKILPLRVLDCYGGGYFSDIRYAFEDLLEYSRDAPERIVVNFSAGVYVDELDRGSLRMVQATEDAVLALHRAGVPVVAAAGNGGTSACRSSPGRVAAVINVAASDVRDRRSSFSDYGRCVDVFAPGTGIRSAWRGSSNADELLDGTSMAAPHVAGVVARFLQRRPEATSNQVWAAIRSDATLGTITDPGQNSPNRLVHSDVDLRVPSAPASVSVSTDHAAGRAVLRWSPPTRDGGRGTTGYRVTRSGTDAAGQGPLSTTVPAGQRSHTFRSLDPTRRYTVTVAAINPVGTGAVATRDTTPLTRPGQPARPTLRSGSTTDRVVSVRAAWKHPSGGRAEHYVLTARPTDGGRTTTARIPGDRTSGSVTGLVAGRSYILSVMAVNAAGQGPKSSPAPRSTAR